MVDLKQLGWDPFFERQLSRQEKAGAVVARIVEPSRGLSRALGEVGEIWAEHKGPHGPAVGDWVVGTLRDAGDAGEKRLTIDRSLDRKLKLGRNAGNDRDFEQILCANTDVAFVTIAANQILNPRAVNRYVDIVKESGMLCVVVLTKIDAPDAQDIAGELKTLAGDLPFHAVSVREKQGLEPLHGYFGDTKTVVLLGNSGAGKSTLVNYFTQAQAQVVGDVREGDQKGRHTTSGRRLHLLPTGGMVIDSPGIREIQPWRPPAAAPKKGKPRPKETARGRWTADEDDE